MKVLFISHSFYPERSAGVELYVDSLMRELSKDHTVMLFTRRKEKEKAFSSSAGNYPIYAIPRKSSERLILEHFMRCLDQFRPDVVHIHHLMGLGPSLVKLLLDRKIPYLITLHDYWYVCGRVRLINHEGRECNFPHDDCGGCLYPESVIKRLIFRMQKTKQKKKILEVLNRAAGVITSSRIIKRQYESYGVTNSRFSILQLGIDPAIIRPVSRSADGPGRCRIGFIGTISCFKGVHILLQAFGSLQGECSLHLYGKVLNKDAPRIMELVRKDARVIVEGQFDHSDLHTVLTRIDLLVVPSICEESHNLVVDEARAAGIPVIASAIGAIPDRIIDGRNGFLVPPGDVNALTGKMKQVLDNYRAALSMDMRMNLVTVRQNAEWYAQVYREIGSARRSGA